MPRFDNNGDASWTLPNALMEKYKTCPSFIETGTYKGGTVQQALNLGFKTIYSVERDDFLFKAVQKRFAKESNVHLYHGNSGEILPDILDLVGDGEALIWLDAHWFNAIEHDLKLVKDKSGACPLLQELNAILDCGTPHHVIMVDDINLLQEGAFETKITLPTILEILEKINPYYNIRYHDSNIKPKDILVASIW